MNGIGWDGSDGSCRWMDGIGRGKSWDGMEMMDG